MAGNNRELNTYYFPGDLVKFVFFENSFTRSCNQEQNLTRVDLQKGDVGLVLDVNLGETLNPFSVNHENIIKLENDEKMLLFSNQFVVCKVLFEGKISFVSTSEIDLVEPGEKTPSIEARIVQSETDRISKQRARTAASLIKKFQNLKKHDERNLSSIDRLIKAEKRIKLDQEHFDFLSDIFIDIFK